MPLYAKIELGDNPIDIFVHNTHALLEAIKEGVLGGDEDFSGCALGSQFTVTIIEMTVDEFEGTPEFTGF